VRRLNDSETGLYNAVYCCVVTRSAHPSQRLLPPPSRLCITRRLSVCLSLSRIAQKVVDEFDEIFRDVVCD